MVINLLNQKQNKTISTSQDIKRQQFTSLDIANPSMFFLFRILITHVADVDS